MVKRLLGYFTICSFLNSCPGANYPIYETEATYVPQKFHVPLFHKQGQVQAEVAWGEGFEFAGGYSPFEHIALVGSLKVRNGRWGVDSNYHHNRNFSVGAGYFISDSSVLRLEVFLHAGNGRTNVVDQYSPIQYIDSPYYYAGFSYEYVRYSAQLNFGIEGEGVGITVSFRPGYMHLYDLSRHITSLPSERIVTNSEHFSRGVFFFDYATTIRIMILEGLGLDFQFIKGRMDNVVGFRAVRSDKYSNHHFMMSLGVNGRFSIF